MTALKKIHGLPADPQLVEAIEARYRGLAALDTRYKMDVSRDTAPEQTVKEISSFYASPLVSTPPKQPGDLKSFVKSHDKMHIPHNNK